MRCKNGGGISKCRRNSAEMIVTQDPVVKTRMYMDKLEEEEEEEEKKEEGRSRKKGVK